MLDLEFGGTPPEDLIARVKALEDLYRNLHGAPGIDRLARGETAAVWSIGPVFRDLDASHPFAFDLIVPENVIQLGYCKLRVKPRPVRSTVDSNQNESSHKHSYGTASSAAGWTNPTFRRTLTLRDSSGNGYTVMVGDDDSSAVPSLSTDTGGAHTHDLTYGIFESTTPENMTLKIDTVDRTAALGGNWDATFDVDITKYLRDSTGKVVRGAHAIEVGTTRLGAVEVYAWFSASIRPVSTIV